MKTTTITTFGPVYGDLREDRYCFYSSPTVKPQCLNIDGENVYIYATKDNGKPLDVKVTHISSLDGSLNSLNPDKAKKIVKKAISMISSIIRDITSTMRLELRLEKLAMDNHTLKGEISKANALIIESQGKIALNESEIRRISKLVK